MSGLIVISRENAKAQGLKRYFTGVPCKNGHITERHISGNCYMCNADLYKKNRESISKQRKQYRKSNKEKFSEYGAQYRKENKEIVSEYGMKYWEANRERLLECKKQYRESNKEKISAEKKRYRESNKESISKSFARYRNANKERFHALSAKRRARKLNAIPSWYGELGDFVVTEAKNLCDRRAAATGFDWHVDHMIPLQARMACGLHCAENIQVIPAKMNISKHNKMWLTQPGEWILRL